MCISSNQNDETKKSNKIYIAIDLKSFYASVECVERKLDPLTTNLVVADVSRTEKTICLAVSPSLKAYGIPGRARLFEVVQKLKEANGNRVQNAPEKKFSGVSSNAKELEEHPEYEISYVAATPRMSLYLTYSNLIYSIYLKYISPEDIHIYSIDEVFMDVSSYLQIYKKTPEELARTIILDVLRTTGITATAGIGTNLYLCKVAMDIVAKHIPADENGVRIAFLDEKIYREKLWNHKPLTDFWRVGRGYARKLEENGLYTMGDVARCSIGNEKDFYNEELLYRLFGINAELLIDHAWGWEPCTIEHVKAYKPQSNCLSSGQVLQCPYSFAKAEIIVQEMTESLVLDLVEKGLVTDQLVLTIGYDIENLMDKEKVKQYKGEITTDYYGRQVPKHAHGTANIGKYSSSTKLITEKVIELYTRIVNPNFTVRRVNVTANHLVKESEALENNRFEQMSLFIDYDTAEKQKEQEKEELAREKRMQQAMIEIKNKYGKNAIVKGIDMREGATMLQRNNQIGGHKA